MGVGIILIVITINFAVTNSMKKKKSNLFALLRILAFLCVIVYLIEVKFRIIHITGESMNPTYHTGDISLLHKKHYENKKIQVGDVVCANVHADGEKVHIIKRVLAIPGDLVVIYEGCLFVNGKINRDYGIGKLPFVAVSHLLKKDEYFLDGDNRQESQFFIVKRNDITGKIIL